MPRGAKIDDDIGGHQVLPDTTAANSEEAKLRSFLDRHANIQAKIDTIMDNASDACVPHRDDMKALKKEAAEAGIPKKVFAAHVTRERNLAKAAAAGRGLSADQRETYEQQVHALGQLAETPLGQAAAAKHPDHPANGAAAH